ncbi:hypothetical protein GE061_019200 [Apolygus lucorum]|uniref:Uncharacterized protein n=1 Tax=Apolygus lucorum TaxID=248454 RepID=A0A6A4JNM8_APOLU|nr:hypothetical protein GE061_019200 [Apolygus lucorum]
MDGSDFDAVCGAAAPALNTQGRPSRRPNSLPRSAGARRSFHPSPPGSPSAQGMCLPPPPPRPPSTRRPCVPASLPRSAGARRSFHPSPPPGSPPPGYDYYSNIAMSPPPMPPPGCPPPFSEYSREALRDRPPAPMPRAQAMCRPPMPLPKPEGFSQCPEGVQQRRRRNPARYMRKRIREGMACLQGRSRSPSPPYYSNLC